LVTGLLLERFQGVLAFFSEGFVNRRTADLAMKSEASSALGIPGKEFRGQGLGLLARTANDNWRIRLFNIQAPDSIDTILKRSLFNERS
jgi:hypothetical protein